MVNTKVIERFVVKAPHGDQKSVYGGTVLETLSNGQVVESALTVIPVDELSEWCPALNAQLLAENQSLQQQIATLTAERDARPTQAQIDAANEQITALQNRINELTAEPNVPIVSRRQARLALLQMGLFDSIEQTVYAPETPKGIRIEYEGDTWRRDNPTLIAMAEQLGMNSETLDQFFQLAGTL